jgi:NAD+ synthase
VTASSESPYEFLCVLVPWWFNFLLVKMKLNCELTSRVLESFIRDELGKAGFSRVVVGLSGGIDSAVSCFLAARALGPENVRAILMPYRTSSKESLTHAGSVLTQLHIKSETIEITPIVDGYFSAQPEAHSLRRGNAMARARMIILFDKSMEQRALVLGTSNKTELLLGYGTLYGDMASAINPIGDLYKTDIIQLAQHLKVPDEIIRKKPTADLWAGQSDEAELGFTYAEVDELLYELIDNRVPREELLRRGFKEDFVQKVIAKIRSSQFKRRGPVICKVSSRTVTHDFHYLRDWGL